MHTSHCISPTPTTQAGLPYHAQARTSAYKRAYAPLYMPCPTHKRRSTDALCQIKPEKVRIQGDPLRAIYGIKPHFLYPLYQKKITPITVSYD